jgi:hypothetical protein
MTHREHSPAYLPRSARRVFAAIERAIGDGSSLIRPIPIASYSLNVQV